MKSKTVVLIKPLSGEFEGLLRLRVGNHRVIFDERKTPSPSTESAIAATFTADESTTFTYRSLS